MAKRARQLERDDFQEEEAASCASAEEVIERELAVLAWDYLDKPATM